MKSSEARSLGRQILRLVAQGEREQALEALSPILVQRLPFRTLDRIGQELGAGSLPSTRAFLADVSQTGALGGWPMIGSCLARQLDRDLSGTIRSCQGFVMEGRTWFTTDILAERVIGLALASDFEGSLDLLGPWRQSHDRWVRRSLGVGVHAWAKRSRGAVSLGPRAGDLLSFLDPLFDERELDAVKGIGWGLKTIGRFYPDRLAGWIRRRLIIERRSCRGLMLHKALTYLSDDQRALAQGADRSGD